MEIKKGEKYYFQDLEVWLNQWENNGVCLTVLEIDSGQRAFMHTFGGNFSKDYLSGDGVLFYDDNEQHSANPDDEFTLLDIIQLKR